MNRDQQSKSSINPSVHPSIHSFRFCYLVIVPATPRTKHLPLVQAHTILVHHEAYPANNALQWDSLVAQLVSYNPRHRRWVSNGFHLELESHPAARMVKCLPTRPPADVLGYVERALMIEPWPFLWFLSVPNNRTILNSGTPFLDTCLQDRQNLPVLKLYDMLAVYQM